MSPQRCPGCGAESRRRAKFCARCGADLQVAARTRQPLQPEEEDESPRALGALIWFLNLCPGLIRPKVVIMSAVSILLALFVGYVAMVVLMAGGMIAGMCIGGFALVIYWAAVSWVLYGYICMPAEALAEFDGKKWLILIMVTVAPIAAVFALAG